MPSLSRLTMSSLVNPMTKDNLDTNIISHDWKLIITISLRFPLCYVMLCIMDFINSIKNLYQFNI